MADAVAEQIAALKDEDWAIREEAAAMLGQLRDPRAVVPLVLILGDHDRAVRDAAIGALTAIGEPSVTALGACLAAPELSIQEAASAALATIADARVVAPLVKALKSHDWIVRMHAAKALGRVKDAQAIAPLIPLLQDKVKAVREEAATALAEIGEASIPFLLEALSCPEWVARLHAVEALGKTRSPSAVEPLLFVLFNDADSAIREDAIRALGEIGDGRAVEFLFMAMKEKGLRPLAVEALGRIKDPRAVPWLIEVVRGTNRPEERRTVAGCGDRWDEEMTTMGAAVRALGAIRDPATIPTLVDALQHTVMRSDAASSLALFGSTVIPFLLPLLNKEQDENIRYHVKETLSQVGWRPGRV